MRYRIFTTDGSFYVTDVERMAIVDSAVLRFYKDGKTLAMASLSRFIFAELIEPSTPPSDSKPKTGEPDAQQEPTKKD